MFKEQQFWKWFGNNSDRLFRLEEEYRDTIFRELSKQLHKVNKGLAFAFSNIRENGKREFVVSADGNKKLFPKVLKLVESAPSFGTWEVVAFRQPVGCFDVNLHTCILKCCDVYFIPLDEGDKLGLDLYIKNYDGSDACKHACIIMLDSILGEYDVEMKIGSIHFSMYDERSADLELISIDKLYELVQEFKKYSEN